MAKVIVVIIGSILGIAIGVGIDALLAFPLTWLLGFTSWHPDYRTVLILLVIFCLLTYGGKKSTSK